MLTKLYCGLISAKTAFVNKMREEKGSHVVEIVIAIAIAIGLLLLFKDKVAELISGVFKQADPTKLAEKATGP